MCRARGVSIEKHVPHLQHIRFASATNTVVVTIMQSCTPQWPSNFPYTRDSLTLLLSHLPTTQPRFVMMVIIVSEAAGEGFSWNNHGIRYCRLFEAFFGRCQHLTNSAFNLGRNAPLLPRSNGHFCRPFLDLRALHFSGDLL